MKKVNSEIYHKLFLQAAEAKEQGMEKLAHSVLDAIGPIPEDEIVSYSSLQLESDLHSGLWKLATHLIKYHDLKSVDIEKLNQSIELFSEAFSQEMEKVLDIQSPIGPLEPKLPGERSDI